MNEVATIEQPAARLPTIHAGGAVRAIVPQDFDSAWRIANAVCKAQMAPRGLDTPEKAMVAIMHGLEVGLTPMNALQSIAVVNGRPTIWGDGALGLVQASGKMSSHKEWFEGAGDTRKALCTCVRKGDPEAKHGEFTVADAKKAGLWGKAGPWTQYSDRMLKMRARAFVLRDGFADVLKGLAIKEEVEDYTIRDGAAREEPPAPPPLVPSAEPEPERQAKAAERPVEPQVSRQHEAEQAATAKDGTSEPAPNAASDPEAFTKFVLDKFAAATGEDLAAVWETYVEPNRGALFPPDLEDLMSAYRKREHEIA
jgi:hypothetical protein